MKTKRIIHTLIYLVSYLFISHLSAVPGLPVATPQTAVYATKDLNGSGTKTRNYPEAFGGDAAHSPKAYAPLAIVKPPLEGETLTVWVHYRGLALQMKRVDAEGNKYSFPWSWDRQEDAFAWRKVGTYPRAELGNELQFIQDKKPTENSGLDAIVITADPNLELDATVTLAATTEVKKGATPSVALSADLPKPSVKTAVYDTSHFNRSDNTVRQFSDAVSGNAAIARKAYSPVAVVDLPPQGDPLSVWLRYRGLALQVKSIDAAGNKQDFPWNWDRQEDGFAWRLVGTYSRATLGEKLQLIHDKKTTDESGLDAIVITGDPAVQPDGAEALPGMPNAEDATVKGLREPPSESTTPGNATVSIDWDAVEGEVAPMVYSINAFYGFMPERVGNPKWIENMRYMNPKLIRFHHAHMTKESIDGKPGWWDTAAGDWDYEKVKASVAHWNAVPDAELMLTLASWLPGMDANDDNQLDPDKIDDYARAAADLVDYINNKLKVGIEYFEITNEKDGAYWVHFDRKGEPMQPEKLIHIFNTVADAVRAVDPDIKLGGPAAMRPDYYSTLRAFVEGTKDNLDFFSVHAYASGDKSEADQSIYDKVQVMAKHLRKLHTMLEEVYAGEPLPELHLNEYNISWTWETREPRMINHKGAVFDALAFSTFATVEGLTATNAWNEQDGIYGKTDKDGNLRPGAHVFHLFNNYHQGRRVQAESSAPDQIVIYATENGSKAHAFTLINRSNGVQTVDLSALTSHTVQTWNSFRIQSDGAKQSADSAALPDTVTLQPHSVNTWFTE